MLRYPKHSSKLTQVLIAIYCISLQSSEVAQVRAKGKSLQLLLAVEALRNDLKRQKTAAEDSKPVGEESTYGT